MYVKLKNKISTINIRHGKNVMMKYIFIKCNNFVYCSHVERTILIYKIIKFHITEVMNYILSVLLKLLPHHDGHGH